MEGLTLMLTLLTPVLTVALVVGLLMAVFQAATQLSDATLGFVPKLLSVAATLWLAGGWMGSEMVSYTSGLWSGLAELVR